MYKCLKKWKLKMIANEIKRINMKQTEKINNKTKERNMSYDEIWASVNLQPDKHVHLN